MSDLIDKYKRMTTRKDRIAFLKTMVRNDHLRIEESEVCAWVVALWQLEYISCLPRDQDVIHAIVNISTTSVQAVHCKTSISDFGFAYAVI